MVIGEIKRHFQKRVMEWWSAVTLTLWGASLLFYVNMFEAYPSYDVMAALFPQPVWGFLAFFVGVARILCLTINGFWRKSPLIRLISSAFSSSLWFIVAYALWQYPIPSTGAFVYSCIVLADIYAAWRAGADLVDTKAKYLISNEAISGE